MTNTTIQISTETKKKLDKLKEYRRETYNDVINRLIDEPKPQTSPISHRTKKHHLTQTEHQTSTQPTEKQIEIETPYTVDIEQEE